MPLKYEIQSDLVVMRARGAIQAKDLRLAVEELSRDESFRPGTPIMLLDEGSSFTALKEEMHVAVEDLKADQTDLIGKVALVTTSDRHFGVGQMIDFYAGMAGAQHRVFHTEQEARDWLLKK